MSKIKSFQFVITMISIMSLILFLLLLGLEAYFTERMKEFSVEYNYNNTRIISLSEGVPGSTVPDTWALKNLLREPFDDKVITRRREEDLVYVSIDEEGFLLPSVQHKNPDLTLAFLGGSTTYCLRVKPEVRFSYLIARRLEKNLSKKVRSLNAAYNRLDTIHSTNILINKVLPKEPDYVFINHAINDLNKLLVIRRYWDSGLFRGYLKKKYSLKNSLLYFKNQYFTNTYEAIRSLPKIATIFKWIPGSSIHKDATTTPGGKTDEWSVFEDQILKFDEKDILSQFKSAQTAIVKIISSWGVTPVLLVQPSFLDNPHVSQNPWANEFFLKIKKKWGLSAEQYVNLYKKMRQAVREVGKETGALVIDLAREIPPTPEFYGDIMHLNNGGSELAANIIGDFLEKKIRKCLKKTGRVQCVE